MKLLFVCTMGKTRSRAAAEAFSKAHDTRYGACPRYLHEYTPKNVVTRDECDWADLVFVMEFWQIAFVRPLSPAGKKIYNLDIPDLYASHDDPDLVKLVTEKVTSILEDCDGTEVGEQFTMLHDNVHPVKRGRGL